MPTKMKKKKKMGTTFPYGNIKKKEERVHPRRNRQEKGRHQSIAKERAVEVEVVQGLERHLKALRAVL